MELGHIIAIGGGGFGRNPKHNKIEKYILSQANEEKPKIQECRKGIKNHPRDRPF